MKCNICDSKTTRINKYKRKPYEQWFNYKDGKICHNCYCNLRYRKKQNRYFELTEIEFAKERERLK